MSLGKGYSKEGGKSARGRVKKGYVSDGTSDDFPTVISFTDKQLPQVKDWKVGSSYKLILEVEQTGVSKDEYEGDSKMRGTFKVKNVKPA